MHGSATLNREEAELYNRDEENNTRERNNSGSSFNLSLDESGDIINEGENIFEGIEPELRDLNATDELLIQEEVREGREFALISSETSFPENENQVKDFLILYINKTISRIKRGIKVMVLKGREQLPLIKLALRVSIILSLTLIPLINELNSVIPLVSMFMNDNNWILVPRLMNKNYINKDILLRLNPYESFFLDLKENSEHKFSFNDLNYEELNGMLLTKHKNKRFKYISDGINVCINNEVGLLAYIGTSGTDNQPSLDFNIRKEGNLNKYHLFSKNYGNRGHGFTDFNSNSRKSIEENETIKLNIPTSWCYSDIHERSSPLHDSRLVSVVSSGLHGRKLGISNINGINTNMVRTVKNAELSKSRVNNLNGHQRAYNFIKLKIHKNTYKFKPTSAFKFISLFFVMFRWFILVSRMVVQIWNSGVNNGFDLAFGIGGETIFGYIGDSLGESSGRSFNGNANGEVEHNNHFTQQMFFNEAKSLVSFCIFYIWSLSCVYLLFGLTTSKCSSFPRIILHESIQWLLWICVVVTLTCFQLVRLSAFYVTENNQQTDSSTGENENVRRERGNSDSFLRFRNRQIFIQHILSIISCCGFGFSLSGSVLLLSTRMTSPWVNSCFITIISQCLDLLLRGYLGLIFDGNLDNINDSEKKIRYYKYVFPVYLLKEEEKVNCNKNGQREWVVKCSHNSNPPPLIFKHNFISIRLNQISPTFYSVSEHFQTAQSKADEEHRDKHYFKDSSNSLSISSSCSSSQISCMICYENQSNIVFSPCLHSGICDVCIDELMKWTVCKLRRSPCCHLCRCPIEIAWQLQVSDDETKTKMSDARVGSFYSKKCIEVIYPKLQIDVGPNEKSN